MKVRLLVYTDRRNPDFNPPDVDPSKPETQTAYYLYRAQVPETYVGDPGPVVDGPDCWRLCLPDGSGEAKRNQPGRIVAEPADDEAQIMLDAKIKEMSPEKRRWYDLALKRLAKEIEAIPPEKPAKAEKAEK